LISISMRAVGTILCRATPNVTRRMFIRLCSICFALLEFYPTARILIINRDVNIFI